MKLAELIRTIPDYPKPGIMFRDITTLLSDPEGFAAVIRSLSDRYRDMNIELVAGIDARGFIIGAPLAIELGQGFVPIRKAGKLPGETISQTYDLEYGTDKVEIHSDVIETGARVLVVDDLIATGGTAEAAVTLIERAGGEIVECAFVVDLPDLGGRGRLENNGKRVHALVAFDGE